MEERRTIDEISRCRRRYVPETWEELGGSRFRLIGLISK